MEPTQTMIEHKCALNLPLNIDDLVFTWTGSRGEICKVVKLTAKMVRVKGLITGYSVLRYPSDVAHIDARYGTIALLKRK